MVSNCKLRAVKWIYKVAALVMLVAWLPATSLCLIEQAGWLTNDNCCPSSHSDSQSVPNDESPCCSLAAGNFKSSEQTVFVSPAFSVVPVLAAPELVSVPLSPIFRSQTPVYLTASWQFLLRTVALPRAPSLVS